MNWSFILKDKKTHNTFLTGYLKAHLLIFCLLCTSVASWGQFYVQEGMIFIISDAQEFVSSQETVNQIDANITGKGMLYLNATSSQTINSTQNKLALPNLQLANATQIQIDTQLHIQHQVIIEKGFLILTHQLVLKNENALVLAHDAGIFTTANGQLVYNNNQLKESFPFSLQQTQTHLLKYTGSKTIPIFTPTSNFGNLVYKDYTVYLKQATPPPKVV